MVAGSVLRKLWDTCLYRAENFLRKNFVGIARIRLVPSRPSKYPSCRNSKRKRRSQKHDQHARGKRLLIWNVWRIEHFNGWNFFHFLNLGQFIFLGQSFENCFLYSRPAIEVRIGNAEQRELADRWIK